MSLDQPNQFVKHQTVTRDAFLGGRITLSQPRHGFRAGLDSVLLGAAVPKGTLRLLDMGAGVGAAAVVALALERASAADLAENDTEALTLANENLVANGFSDQARVIAVDVTAASAERRRAGLFDNVYDVVIANPPFFAKGQGTLAPAEGRAKARHMETESLDLWARAAAASLAANGQLILIYPAEGLSTVLAALQNRFGGIIILPLSPRPGALASRILVRGTKGSRAPLGLLSSRAMHGPEGNGFSPEFDAIFRGRSALDW